MKNTVERLKKILTYRELAILRTINKELDGKNEGAFVMAKIADEHKASKSSLIVAFRILAAAGVAETNSMGSSGTVVFITDREVFDQVLER